MAVDVASLSFLTENLSDQEEEISKVNLRRLKNLLSKQEMQKEVLRENLRQASCRIEQVEQEKKSIAADLAGLRSNYEQRQHQHQELQPQHAKRELPGRGASISIEAPAKYTISSNKGQQQQDLYLLSQSLSDQLSRTKTAFQSAKEEWSLRQKRYEDKVDGLQALVNSEKQKVVELLGQRRCWLQGKSVLQEKISRLEEDGKKIRDAAEKAQLRLKLQHEKEVKQLMKEQQKLLQGRKDETEGIPAELLERLRKWKEDATSESLAKQAEDKAKMEQMMKKTRVEASKQKQECEELVVKLQGRIQELEVAQQQKLKQLATKMKLNSHNASKERDAGLQEANAVIKTQLQTQSERVQEKQAEVKNAQSRLREVEAKLEESKENTRSVRSKYKEALRSLMSEVEKYKKKLKETKKSLTSAEAQLQR